MRDTQDKNRKPANLKGFPTKSGIKAGGLEYDFTNGGTNQLPPPPGGSTGS